MHADGLDGRYFAQLCQVFLKRYVSLVHISGAKIHILIVVTYLMPQRGNLLNDSGIERLRNDPEIIGSRYPHFMLQTRKIQSILRHFVHIMAEDDYLGSRFNQVRAERLKNAIRFFQGIKQTGICFKSVISHLFVL